MAEEYVVTFDFRTGERRHPVVEMPDGRRRAVWRKFNGSSFEGFFTKAIGGRVEPTTEEDYEEYRERVRAWDQARIERLFRGPQPSE